MGYTLRFEAGESSCGSGWMVFDNEIMYCMAGPMSEEAACDLAAELNAKEQQCRLGVTYMATNRYGVDTAYFHRWFDRSLKDLSNYRPDELARELARMAKAADKSVLGEKEFSGPHCWEIGTKETCDCPDCGSSLVGM